MAECHLFDAKDLNNFGVNWMERNFRYLEGRDETVTPLVSRSAGLWEGF